jgi:signal transduction histidine kinase
VGNASHQLRTPLTGLRLRLEAAALKARDPELRAELEAGEREVERLARTVSTLLVLARDGERAPTTATTSLAAAADAAVARWSAVADHQDRDLRANEAPDVAAEVSEEDLAVVLDNLISNALRHAPSGGEVVLDWGRDGERAWVAVSDDGRGFAPGDADRAFERFYSRSSGNDGEGTGLGLAIVRTLVERWGGQVRLQNRLQGGAFVFVRLPLAPGAARGRRQPAVRQVAEAMRRR